METNTDKKVIQLYSWASVKGGPRLELIGPDNMTLAVLYTQDFKRMSDAGQSSESDLDIIVYCNEYKGTRLDTKLTTLKRIKS